MNQREWKRLCKVDKHLLNWYYYNKTRKLQKSLQFNTNENATVIHHLRDTEEQREYNDTYYEYWGFNQDGTFEYGKYVIFLTKEEHTEIHKLSEETRQKISEANKNKIVSKETREKMHEAWVGHEVSEETRKKISEANKGRFVGEKSPNYGKHLTEEQKDLISKNRKGKCAGSEHWLYGKQLPDDIKQRISKTHKENMTEERRKIISETTKAAMATDEVKIKMSESHKGIYPSDEAREKMSISQKASWTDERRKIYSENNSGEKSCWYGKHHSDESKSKMSESHKQLWDEERKLTYTGSGNPMYGKHHTEETIAKMKRIKQEKKAMFENIKNIISNLTWKLFLSYYSEYKKELSRAPSLEEMHSYILSKESNFQVINHT